MTAVSVLAHHQWQILNPLCQCGAKVIGDPGMAQHQADMLAAEGYVTVELPGPDVDGGWCDPMYDWSVRSRNAYDGDIALVLTAVAAMDPDDAQTFAAAVLAAANKTEVHT